MSRDGFIIWLFDSTNEIYRKVKKNKAWGLCTQDLLDYPRGSIGHSLGCFLSRNGFEPLENSERHDVFHVLTQFGTNVPDEIKMQFYLLGNGKRSPYLFAVIITGALFYPDYWLQFLSAFKKGGQAKPFHDLCYQTLLMKNIHQHRKNFNIQPVNR